MVLAKAPGGGKKQQPTPHHSSPSIISSLLLFTLLSMFVLSFSSPLSPLLRARLWSVHKTSGKLFGNQNLSEII